MMMLRDKPKDAADAQWWYGGDGQVPSELFIQLGEIVIQQRNSKQGRASAQEPEAREYRNIRGSLGYKSFRELMELRWELLDDSLTGQAKKDRKDALRIQRENCKKLVSAISHTMGSRLLLKVIDRVEQARKRTSQLWSQADILVLCKVRRVRDDAKCNVYGFKICLCLRV